MKPWQYAVIGVVVGVVLVVVWGLVTRKTTIAPTVNIQNQALNSNAANTNQANTNTAPLTDTSFFSTSDLPDRDPAFNFSASLPSGWVAESVAGSQAINLYNSGAAGDSSLEKSQIFIRFFQSSEFLTLSTVTIKSRAESTINGRPAVTYVIEKKSGVADFPSQPSWRNLEHRVTDIRSSDTSPTVFYVFAKAPGLDQKTFDAFLQSISFSSVGASDRPVYPLEDFVARVTVKQFAQYITPQNSPIQPERFSGYHTGVDAETLPTDAEDIPVYAIADGTVKLARTANGYGGVMLIEHQVGDEIVTAVYGHVRLSSVRKPAGQSVRKAEQIAMLGTGGTSETDGERQHLHFGLVRGSQIELRGYVSDRNLLSGWHDPLAWLASHDAMQTSVIL